MNESRDESRGPLEMTAEAQRPRRRRSVVEGGIEMRRF
jgi:hypothetical protein